MPARPYAEHKGRVGGGVRLSSPNCYGLSLYGMGVQLAYIGEKSGSRTGIGPAIVK